MRNSHGDGDRRLSRHGSGYRQKRCARTGACCVVAMSRPCTRTNWPLIEDVDVFARVSPEHKVRIVGHSGRDHVVAMTGDSISDAPAQAGEHWRGNGHCRHGCHEGTDMVLTDDNYVSIVWLWVGAGDLPNIQVCVLPAKLQPGRDRRHLLGDAGGHSFATDADQLLWLNLLTDGARAAWV